MFFLFFSLYRCRCALVVIDLQNKADETVKKMSSKGAVRGGRLKADERRGGGLVRTGLLFVSETVEG